MSQSNRTANINDAWLPFIQERQVTQIETTSFLLYASLNLHLHSQIKFELMTLEINASTDYLSESDI